MKILSLFDGMACGMLAFKKFDIDIERYVAYEIDKYCVQTTMHNFPEIEHRGDVFDADFTEFEGFDFVIGGSPCTYWSIAQKNNRETEASGLGWELFSQYVRAIKEAKPKYFIYENNKSMSKAIRESIDKAFGFEAVLINSALVSAQNRQRLYWVGRRNEDGTYSKVDVRLPDDRGILLKDILETGVDLTSNNKSWALTASYDGAVAWTTIERSQRNMVAEPLSFSMVGDLNNRRAGVSKKAYCLAANPSSDMTVRCIEPVRIPPYGSSEKARPLNAHYSNNCGGFEHRMFSENPNKQQVDMVAEPVRVGTMPKPNGEVIESQGYRIYDANGKSCTICAGQTRPEARAGIYAIEAECLRVKEATKKGYVDIEPGDCVDLTQPNSKTRRGRNMKEKSNCLMTSCQYYQDCGTVNQPIYEVKDGLITIKGKQYPIKLVDGYYIIRKLTVRECMRLQTVPEWYEFPVSNSQAYKMLGNGWTVEVIAHIISEILERNYDA